MKANVVFLRGSYFIENWEMDLAALRSSDVFTTFLRADHRIPQVAVRDLGNVIAELLTRPLNGHTVVEYTGPTEWSPAEIAQEMGEVTGKSVRVQHLPTSSATEVLTQFGVPRPVATLLQEMYEGLDSGQVSFESQQTVRRGETFAKDAIAAMWNRAAAVA